MSDQTPRPINRDAVNKLTEQLRASAGKVDGLEGRLEDMEIVPPCYCRGEQIPGVQRLADHYGFTYQQALDYIIVIGIAHAKPPE